MALRLSTVEEMEVIAMHVYQAFFSRAIAAVKAYAERQRLARELYALNDRLLADAGFTREDIPAVVDGTYVRQPDSAPIERPLGLRPAHATGGTAGSVANDNEAQIAA